MRVCPSVASIATRRNTKWRCRFYQAIVLHKTWVTFYAFSVRKKNVCYATQLGRDKFHKSHVFDYNGDVYNFVGEHKSGIGWTSTYCVVVTVGLFIPPTGGQTLPGGKPKPKKSVYPKGLGSNRPAWVAFDRQVTVLLFLMQKTYA